MKKFNPYLLVLIGAITIASCKKDNPSSATNVISGNYKFIELGANTESTVQYMQESDMIKTVTTSHYNSTDNAGSVTITGNTFTGKDISYSIDDNSVAYTYLNNELLDSMEMPFSYTIPPSNSVSNYQLVGQDSIYFTSGSIINTSTGNSTEAIPTGCRFTVEGNTLKLNCRATKESTQVDNGITTNVKQSGVFTMTLEKQ